MSARTGSGHRRRLRPRARCAVLLDGVVPRAVAAADVASAPGARTLVVLDDACESLERIASAGMRAGPVGAWQRRALLRSLRAAEPAEGAALELLALGRNATAQARACLVRTRPTAAAIAQVDALVADGARIVAVTTVSRLLARVYGRHPVPRLFVARTDVDERHVLVVDGVPCFSRTVGLEPGTEDRTAAVAQSLEHLAGRHAAGCTDIAGIGLDDETLEAYRSLDHVGEARHVSRVDLAATLRARVQERVRGPSFRYRTAHVPALLRACDSASADTGPGRQAMTAAAALCTALAVLSAGHALATRAGIERAASTLAAERARLEGELEAGRAALAPLHDRPFGAAASLARAERLDGSALPGADVVLTLVATALREDDALHIDTIAWAMPSEYGSDAVYTDPASLPVREPDVEGAPVGSLDVEIAGRVAGASDVGAAERAVGALTARLVGLAGVATPVRLDSPLERAAAGAFVAVRSGRNALDGASEGDASGWRLRFSLVGSGNVR